MIEAVETAGAPPGMQIRQYLRVQRAWRVYFDQGQYWQPNGRPRIDIADMDDEWRYNCTRYLKRNALAYARNYAQGCEAEVVLAAEFLGGEVALDSVEREMEAVALRALADPAKWIESTALYQALRVKLPQKGKKLRHLAQRASHYDGCPRRVYRKGECHCVRLKEELEERQRVEARERDSALERPEG